MLPYSSLIVLDRQSAIPLYQQIAHGLIQLIQTRVLQPEAILPGTRQMAKFLTVHRKTVIAAYDELYAQNWVDILPRRHIKVAQTLPNLNPLDWQTSASADYPTRLNSYVHTVQKETINRPKKSINPVNLRIDDGFPDERIAPFDLLLREYRSLTRRNALGRTYQPTEASGAKLLRQTLVSYLSITRGLSLKDNNILITQGAQMGLYLAASLLIQPGDYVIVGEPGYFLANAVFEQLGAKILPVAVDDNGLDISSVQTLCQTHPVRLVYVIPHHHHPTTATLSAERRMGLRQLAQRFSFAILEDDYDYDFQYNAAPYLPIASARQEGTVIYIGSFSKALSRSVRIGFMVASADLIERALQLRRLIDLSGDQYMETALATLIQNGDIGRHLKRASKLYRSRRDWLCTLLDTHLSQVLTFRKPTGGMAIWAKFDHSYLLATIAQEAAQQGLLMSNGNLYNTNGQTYNALRIGFASLTEKEMEQVVLILAKITS